MLKKLSKKKKIKDVVSTDLVSGKDTEEQEKSENILPSENKIQKKTKKSSVEILKKIKLFDKIAKYSIYSLIALLPIFFLPTTLIEINQAKIGLLLLAVLVATISIGLSAVYSGGIKLISKKVLIPVVLISLITFISSAFSTSYKGSFLGLGTEIDSWYLTSILLLITILVALVVNTKEKIFTAVSLFWVSFGLASLFQLLRLLAAAWKMGLASALLNFGGQFSSSELTTVGTWSDFGIVAGVAALSLAVTLDMVPLKKTVRNTAWSLFTISALMSFVASSILIGSGIDQLTNGSQFTIPSMTIVGLFALFFALFQLKQRRQSRKQEKGGQENVGQEKVGQAELTDSESSLQSSALEIKFPIASFILICLGVVTLISPLALNQKINSSVGVASESVLNIRPGISDTYEVSKGVLSSSVKNSLIGVGSHGFYIAWNRYRPAYINTLDSWNTDYQFGVGYLPTSLINNGILGFLLWIVSLIALFWVGFLAIFKSKGKDSSSVYTDIIMFLSALLLWVNATINVSGSMVVILTFIFTGFLLASLVSNKKIKTVNYSLSRSFIVVIFVLSIIMIAFSFTWIQRTRAQVYSTEAMRIIYAKDANISSIPKAMDLLKKSFDIYPTDAYAKGINNLALVQVNYDISSDPTGQNMQALQSGQPIQMSSSTSAYLNVAISSGKASTDANPNDFRNFLQFGSTMQAVALTTANQNAGKLALQDFLQAESLARNHPLPLYSLANLYALAGDKDSAKIILEQTLRIKPNFTEASDLYQKLSEAPTSTTTPNINGTSTSSMAPSSSMLKTSTSTNSTSARVKVPVHATTTKTPVTKKTSINPVTNTTNVVKSAN